MNLTLRHALFVIACSSPCLGAEPPRLFSPDPAWPVTFLQRSDGNFGFLHRRDPKRAVAVLEASGAVIPLQPQVPLSLPVKGTRLRGEALLLGADGEAHEFWTQLRDERSGQPHQLGVNYFIDIWHSRTQGGGQTWEAPRPIWRGYTGAVMGYVQLRSGRLLIPFGSWIPNSKATPPTGTHEVTVLFSDDHGHTWQETADRLTSPCYDGYNGNNYGACEPVVVELSNGRLWMLMRTQTGFLYESFSDDQGTHWQPARASRFPTSTGPPALARDARDRLFVVWNHCELPPRVEGAGVYGGRDALHAAMSTDQGRTWHGFREIYRDATRHASPPKEGDRGTAYPRAAFDRAGQLTVLSGQGEGRRKLIQVDPEWLLETSASTDFADGLDSWHAFKPEGPPRQWWRDRTLGAELVSHPLHQGARCLKLSRPDDLAPDGATWNFPNAWKGHLTLQLRLEPGGQGGSIALTDRFFDPTDDQGEQFAAFRLHFTSDDRANSLQLPPGVFHELTLRWDLSQSACEVLLNGSQRLTLPLQHRTLNGLSYLRFRSIASHRDPSGFLVAQVKMQATDTAAPMCSPEQQQATEKHYRDTVIPTWQRKPSQKTSDPTQPARVGGKPVG